MASKRGVLKLINIQSLATPSPSPAVVTRVSKECSSYEESKITKSPWITFPARISALSKFLLPHSVKLITKYHCDHKERKITRRDLIQQVRKLAGDEFCNHQVKSCKNKVLDAEGVEANSLFDEPQSTLSTHQGEMALFAGELRQMLRDAGFDEVIAEHRTEQFINVLGKELNTMEKERDSFIQEF